MIFNDRLTFIRERIEPEFDRLLQLAWENQKHIGDLLIWKINGFYHADIVKYNAIYNEKMNPHSLGPGIEGHSEYTHYQFIDLYRKTNISKINYTDYLKLHEWSEDRKKEIDELCYSESISIQLEMLVYLKIWEADLFIKRLYQFVRILNGNNYDWYFKIAKFNRDSSPSTGTRKHIFNKEILEASKAISSVFYDLIKGSYISQLRNSIAHSNYSIISRFIHLNNAEKKDDIEVVSFDNWIDIFHQTLELYNQYIRLTIRIHNHYVKIASKNNNILEIQVTELSGKEYPKYVEYRPVFNDWKFYSGDASNG